MAMAVMITELLSLDSIVLADYQTILGLLLVEVTQHFRILVLRFVEMVLISSGIPAMIAI